MKKFLEQLFCKHEYLIAGTLKYKGQLRFLECSHCGKRKVEGHSYFSYPKQMRNLINIWKKQKVKINFNEEGADEGNR